MGKGNRNKLDRAQAQIDTPEEYLAQRRKLNKKNKDKTGRGVTITCIVLVVAILLSIAIGALASGGVFARMTNTVSTENFVVTEAMLQYFYNEYILNWINSDQYAYMYVMYGMVDLSSDLREQKCSLTETGTWYDYFMDGTLQNVTMYLEYAEGAKAAGITLDDADYDEIDETVKAMKKALRENGESISDRYGDHVSASDVRKCYELIYLASKFNEVKMEELEAAARADDEKVLAYPGSHKSDFYSAEYISYTITIKSNDSKYAGKDVLFDEAKAKAKADAEVIAAAKDPKDFFEQIKVYTEAQKEEVTSEGKTTAAKELKYEDYTKEIAYGESSDLEKWLFVETASENDAKVIEESSTETVTDSSGKSNKVDVYKYTAYMVIEPMALNTDRTVNLGYLITTDKAIAEELRNSFLASDNKTSKSLNELAQSKLKEITANGSDATLSSDYSKNAMTNAFKNSYAEFDTWLNADGRKPGDLSEVLTIAPASDTTPTYYIVGYFEDWSDPVWRAQAIGSIVGEGMDEWYMGADGKGGQLAITPVTIKERSANGIDVSRYFFNLMSSLRSSAS